MKRWPLVEIADNIPWFASSMRALAVHKMKLSIWATAMLLTIQPTTSDACADAFACAVVKETHDGFVALRFKPTARSQMLQQLKPYEIIGIYVNDCEADEEW